MSEKRSVFVLGDSISILYGPYLKRMLSGIYNYDRKRGEDEALKDLDRPVGANGGDSQMVLDYLSDEYQKKSAYDLLLLNCGLHDLRTDPQSGIKQISITLYAENLDKIVALAKGMSNEVLWVRTTPINDKVHNHCSPGFVRYNSDVEEYNKVADEITQLHGIQTLDLYSFTCNLGKEEIYVDHVHFNEEVRAAHAAFIAGFLAAQKY